MLGGSIPLEGGPTRSASRTKDLVIGKSALRPVVWAPLQ